MGMEELVLSPASRSSFIARRLSDAAGPCALHLSQQLQLALLTPLPPPRADAPRALSPLLPALRMSAPAPPSLLKHRWLVQGEAHIKKFCALREHGVLDVGGPSILSSVWKGAGADRPPPALASFHAMHAASELMQDISRGAGEQRLSGELLHWLVRLSPRNGYAHPNLTDYLDFVRLAELAGVAPQSPLLHPRDRGVIDKRISMAWADCKRQFTSRDPP